MARMPRQSPYGGFPPPGHSPPQQPRRRRIRWKLRRIWLVLPVICLLCLAFLWLISHLDIEFDLDLDLDSCLRSLGIAETDAFARLMLWGLALILIVAFLRVLRGKRNDGN